MNLPTEQWQQCSCELARYHALVFVWAEAELMNINDILTRPWWLDAVFEHHYYS